MRVYLKKLVGLEKDVNSILEKLSILEKVDVALNKMDEQAAFGQDRRGKLIVSGDGSSIKPLGNSK